jgi:hypothetical protein
MRADPGKQHARPRASAVTAGEATAWRAPAAAAEGEERLAWPLAAGVIALLSAGLWLGIGWLAHLALD